MKTFEFDAVLETPEDMKTATYIFFPYEVEQAFGRKGNLKVCGTIDNVPFRSSLFNMNMQHHIMVVNKSIKQKAKKKTGDTVHVIMYEDIQERKIILPDYIKQEFESDAIVWDMYNSMSFSHQREIFQWIEEAKKQETKQNRILKAMQMLQVKFKEKQIKLERKNSRSK
jgi:hypothetical protein